MRYSVSRSRTAAKEVARRLASAAGMEIHRQGSPCPLPEWITEPPPQLDDVVAEGWIYNVLHMANRSHRPPELAYRRTEYGEDQRLKYVLYFLDLRGLRILELGPLEGHHSVLFEKLGVAANTAVESREDNLRKCLRVKEKYALDRTTYLRGDVESIALGQESSELNGGFDMVICMGLLYHVTDPYTVLRWMRTQAPILFLATHYVEPMHSAAFVAGVEESFTSSGHRYRVKRWVEGGLQDPKSGMSAYSVIPFEDDLLRMVRDAGYSRVSVLGKDLQNRAPHITLLAEA